MTQENEETNNSPTEDNVLDVETNIIQSFFKNPRMNKYIILFYMLNNPYERVTTNDFKGILSNETAYILPSFVSLEDEGFIESVGKFEREHVFHISDSNFDEARKFMCEKCLRYIKNQYKINATEIIAMDLFFAFRKIMSFDSSVLLKERIERIKLQLNDCPNDAFLMNIKNKLEKKFNDRIRIE